MASEVAAQVKEQRGTCSAACALHPVGLLTSSASTELKFILPSQPERERERERGACVCARALACVCSELQRDAPQRECLSHTQHTHTHTQDAPASPLDGLGFVVYRLGFRLTPPIAKTTAPRPWLAALGFRF
jgi:hypothetical protein